MIQTLRYHLCRTLADAVLACADATDSVAVTLRLAGIDASVDQRNTRAKVEQISDALYHLAGRLQDRARDAAELSAHHYTCACAVLAYLANRPGSLAWAYRRADAAWARYEARIEALYGVEVFE